MWKAILKWLSKWCPWIDELGDGQDEHPQQPDVYADELDVSAIRVHGIDWRGWPAEYDLAVKHSGSGVYLEQELTSTLPSIDDNVGSCWFITRASDQGWHAYRWDQIRGGQKKRDFPWNPPHPKDGESYATAKRHQEVYVCVTSMARDHKRNGDVRTKIARLQ